MLLQFTNERFRKSHEVTIGVEFGAKLINVDGRDIKLQIWDTAGQEHFKSITKSYYKSAAGAIIVFDVSRRDSFDAVQKWLNDAQINGNETMSFIIVGNKTDLEEE